MVAEAKARRAEPAVVPWRVRVGIDAEQAAGLHRESQQPLGRVQPVRPRVDLHRGARRDLFDLLITVKNVGPSTAIAIVAPALIFAQLTIQNGIEWTVKGDFTRKVGDARKLDGPKLKGADAAITLAWLFATLPAMPAITAEVRRRRG